MILNKQQSTVCVGFNVPLVILKSGLSRQSLALILTTKNQETKHIIHAKQKRETEKTAIANETIYTLIW